MRFFVKTGAVIKCPPFNKNGANRIKRRVPCFLKLIMDIVDDRAIQYSDDPVIRIRYPDGINVFRRRRSDIFE